MYDRQQLQRGFQVYKEVCAACHCLNLVAFRDLEDLGYNEAEVKAIANAMADRGAVHQPGHRRARDPQGDPGRQVPDALCQRGRGARGEQQCAAARSCEVEHRRRDIGELHDILDTASGFLARRRLDDEGDAKGLVVDEQTVSVLAVVTQSFAMVRYQDDRALIVELMCLEVLHQPADDFVKRRHRFVVQPRVRGLVVREESWWAGQVEKQKRARRGGGRQPLFGYQLGRRASRQTSGAETPGAEPSSKNEKP